MNRFATLLSSFCCLTLTVTGQARCAPPVDTGPLAEPLRAALHGALGPHGTYVDDAGVIRGEGEPYRATFVDAAEVEVASGDDGNPVARLRLRFAGARRGATWLPRDPAAQPALAGDVVRWQHGPVTETYTMQAVGVEQSFVFAERPTGTGDLVVEVAADGNVAAAATERAAHQPVHWHDGHGAAIRYGEAFAFDRRGARITIATAYDGAGRITLTVPGAFVDDAVLPLTVDPVVGPLLQPGGAPDNDTQPAVAFDPGSDRYLVVWRRITAGVPAIRGAVYTGNGTVVNALVSIATGSATRDVREPVACLCRDLDPDGFVVAWTETNVGVGSAPAGVFARAIGQFGVPLAPGFRVNTTAGTIDDQPTISGPEGAILIAWRIVTPGFSAIKMRDLYWTDPTNPNVVSSGPERLLATATGTTQIRNPQLAVNNARVSPSGPVLYANRIVWEQTYASQADIWTMSFQVGNNPFNFLGVSGPVAVPNANSPSENEINPSIAAMASAWQDPTDHRFLVAWQDGSNIVGQRYSMVGPVGAAIPVRVTPAFSGVPAVGAGQTEFTVGYMELPPGSLLDVDVFAARVLADGTVAQSHRLVDDPGTALQADLVATSQPLPVAGQPLRNTTLLAWSGRTGPAGGPDDIRARFYEPVAATGYLFGVGCAGPGGSLPAIGWSGGDPHAGNTSFAITISNAPPASLCALLVGSAPTSVPLPGTAGCWLFADLPFLTVLPAISDLTGSAVLPLPIPLDIPLGWVYLQWGVYTPGFNAFGWITSNDIDLGWSD